jgi:hypothetical protein
VIVRLNICTAANSSLVFAVLNHVSGNGSINSIKSVYTARRLVYQSHFIFLSEVLPAKPFPPFRKRLGIAAKVGNWWSFRLYGPSNLIPASLLERETKAFTSHGNVINLGGQVQTAFNKTVSLLLRGSDSSFDKETALLEKSRGRCHNHMFVSIYSLGNYLHRQLFVLWAR